MKPAKMISPHIPSLGLYGDCYRACVASLLELPSEKVPHFVKDDPSNEVFYARVNKFLKPMGFTRVAIPFGIDPRITMKLINPGLYYILSGVTDSGVGHSLVCFEDKVVHDPSPSQLELVGPLPDEDEEQESFWWVEFFGASILRGSDTKVEND